MMNLSLPPDKLRSFIRSASHLYSWSGISHLLLLKMVQEHCAMAGIGQAGC
jgi:hypothetical protein